MSSGAQVVPRPQGGGAQRHSGVGTQWRQGSGTTTLDRFRSGWRSPARADSSGLWRSGTSGASDATNMPIHFGTNIVCRLQHTSGRIRPWMLNTTLSHHQCEHLSTDLGRPPPPPPLPIAHHTEAGSPTSGAPPPPPAAAAARRAPSLSAWPRRTSRPARLDRAPAPSEHHDAPSRIDGERPPLAVIAPHRAHVAPLFGHTKAGQRPHPRPVLCRMGGRSEHARCVPHRSSGERLAL